MPDHPAASLGRRSTAESALRGARLDGRIAVVTGASSGLGVETTRVLALAGADVVMACRDPAAATQVAERVRASLPAGAGALIVRALDLADLRSVERFVATLVAEYPRVDVLVNNAGVMATPLGFTAQGHELQLGVDHLGHFLLTLGLLPALEAAGAARVVTLSSAMHTRGRGERMMTTLGDDPRYERRRYQPFEAYGDAKLANALFVHALARHAPSVAAFAVHPGVIPTPLSRHMGPLGAVFRTIGRPFMKTVAQGAATSIHAAVAPELVGHSGAYLADCRITTPSVEARDDALASALWQRSEALVAEFRPPV